MRDRCDEGAEANALQISNVMVGDDLMIADNHGWISKKKVTLTLTGQIPTKRRVVLNSHCIVCINEGVSYGLAGNGRSYMDFAKHFPTPLTQI